MPRIALDSSAVLAMVYSETVGSKVRAAILSSQNTVFISAVNWCEVLTELGQKSPIMTAEKLTAILPGVTLMPFGQAEAEQVATLAKNCPSISWAQTPMGAMLEMLR